MTILLDSAAPAATEFGLAAAPGPVVADLTRNMDGNRSANCRSTTDR